jgi:hypothetical protein
LNEHCAYDLTSIIWLHAHPSHSDPEDGHSSKALASTYKFTQCHNPEHDLDLSHMLFI